MQDDSPLNRGLPPLDVMRLAALFGGIDRVDPSEKRDDVAVVPSESMPLA